MRLLTQLTGKAKQTWGPKQENAFKILKHVIFTELVLALPQDNCSFWVEADLSNFAIGTILSQKVNNKQQPIAFISKIYDKELLVIITALEECHYYLLEASEPFEVWLDH